MKRYLVVVLAMLTFVTGLLHAGDGERDATFGSGGGVIAHFFSEVKAIAIQVDGKIVIAERSIVRYHRDGSLDASFGIGAGSSVFSLRGGYVFALAI